MPGENTPDVNDQSSGDTISADDLYTMSDEQILNLNTDKFEMEEGVTELNEETETEEEELDTSETSESDDSTQTEEQEDESTEGETEETEEQESEETQTEETEEESETEDENESDKEVDSTDQDKTKNKKPDAADSSENASKLAAYEKIMAPFKANGVEMTVNSPEEAIALMQKGVDYTRKMQGMKPGLQTLKLLEKADIKDNDTLNFLIDLHQGKKEAISKLVQQSGIDPVELDLEGSDSYQPTQHTADKSVATAVELEQAIDGIRGTPTFDRTVDVIGNKWDDESRTFVNENPGMLKIINDHMANGVYDQVNTEVVKQRTLGNLDGVSDVRAYELIVEYYRQQKGFDHLKQNDEPAAESKVVRPTSKKASSKTTARKKAASNPAAKSAKETSVDKDFNFLNMSDDEFLKKHAGA